MIDADQHQHQRAAICAARQQARAEARREAHACQDCEMCRDLQAEMRRAIDQLTRALEKAVERNSQ